jgi:ABC-type lipoprotein release transport system permease subunit
MKRTQVKDALRNIRSRKVSFLSIILIALLGVAAFLGLDYSAAALTRNGSEHFAAQRFRDVEAVSTLLFSQEDLKDILETDGVADAETVWQVGAKASAGGDRVNVTVISLTERLNLTQLVDGRLPETETECAVERKLAEDMGWAVGSEILVQSPSGEIVQYLKGDRFTITGIADHPDHNNHLITDTFYVQLIPAAFDQEALEGCFMKAEIAVDGAEGDRFSEPYAGAVSAVCARLEALEAKNAPRRDAESRAQRQARLDDAQREIDDARDALSGKRRDLDEGWAALADGERTLRETQARLADTKAELDEAKEQLDEAKSRLDETEARLRAVGAFAALAALEAEWEQYGEQLAAYEAGSAQYAQGLLDAESGERELAENREALETGESEYADGLAELRDAEEQLAKAREQAERAAPCEWLIFDMNGNPGYVQISGGQKNLNDLKGTFSTLFVLIGALVIFATVSKMVDEQCKLVGTMKALGFYKKEILRKYLIFGVFATVLGTVLGILAARYALQSVLLRGYDGDSNFDLAKPAIVASSTLLAIIAAAALSVTAVSAACLGLLRTSAIRLMQDRLPAGAKKTGGERRRVLSLYSRLILLNMRTDFRRVLVTTVSVAGCCALIVIGVTLRTAMLGSLDRQLDEIVAYDWQVRFSPEESDTAAEEIEALLTEAGTDSAAFCHADAFYRFDTLQIAELFCGDMDEIGEFYHLRDWKTGERLRGTDAGILIQRRVAESYGLDRGSVFELVLGGTRTADVAVAGVFEQYFGRAMIMSPAYYEQAFGETCRPNAFFVRLNGADADALEKAIRSVKGFEALTAGDAGRETFEESTGVINTLVALFIFMAAVMAGVVQMNLTNIYVLQKRRELTIMRINGFTVKEVVGYMLRETALTTAAGILLGFVLGAKIAEKICRTMELPFLQFVRGVSVPALITGAALTLLFTVLVNIIALRPVRDLKLTDALSK